MENKRSFMIPMIVSLALLLGFLGYFLRDEYKKEKEAMLLASKEFKFDNFFATIDTLAVGKFNENIPPQLMIKKDSFGKVSQYHFNFQRSEEKERVELIKDDKTEIRIQVLELPEIREKDKSSLKNKSFSSFSDHLFLGRDEYRLEQKDEIMAWVNQDDIPFWKVIPRLLPQMILSILLLLSVSLAYWYTTRSLRKERELALIRNNFMSNMSHELKTPVSTIGVALEALSTFDAADKPELRKEYIDISRHEVERLGLLVDKALNISLYEQGQFVFDLQNIDLKKEIEKVLKTLKVQLDNQNVDLDYRYKGTDFIVSVDRTHMINVVYNLIENGIKYSSDGAEIDIYLEDRGSFLRVSISDKGYGIAPEHQARVFEKFYRVQEGNTHDVKGHGLGLSYVKEVVEAMGGTIHLKSGVNAGSTFIIEIPKNDE